MSASIAGLKGANLAEIEHLIEVQKDLIDIPREARHVLAISVRIGHVFVGRAPDDE